MLTSIECVMRDNHTYVVMVKDKRIGDCYILVTERLTVREAILIIIKKIVR